MTRQRGGATRRRDNEHMPSTPAEIGRLLQHAREQRGLDLLTVHDRLNRPITQLEALEAGNLADLPDQAFALSTLRRYATLLTLDGDALALQMMEAWPSSPTKSSRRSRRDAMPLSGVVTAVTTAPDHLRAFTQTGQVPRVDRAGTAAAGGSGAYGYGGTTGPPTGMLSAVPHEEVKDSRRAVAKARRRRRAPKPLRLVTFLTFLLLVVALAGSVIQHNEPRWLINVHITNPNHAVGTTGTTGTTGTGSSGSSRRTSSNAQPVRLSTTDNLSSATYTVDAQHFAVSIATSAPCWVQVSSPASVTPIAQDTQQAGQIESYKADGSLIVEVGSSAAVVGISINGKNVFLNVPKNAPFTYTFTGRSTSATSTTSTSSP